MATRNMPEEIRFSELLSQQELIQLDVLVREPVGMKAMVERARTLFPQLQRFKFHNLGTHLAGYKEMSLRRNMEERREAAAVDASLHIEKVDAVKMMEELVLIQHTRVHKMLKREKDAPIVLETTSKEIMNLQTMVDKLANLHMDTGIVRRVPKDFVLEIETKDPNMVEVYVSTEVAEAMQVFLSHESSDNDRSSKAKPVN